jgi:outer membrane protein OmpA-like peptidoglycan-associated protein
MTRTKILTESSEKTFPKEDPENKKPKKNEELNEVRQILFGREQTEILRLKEQMDNPRLFVKYVERVLPDAIKLRTPHDKEMAKALEPHIEKGLNLSIKKNPKALADTLYPIMGPSIRKAITSTILNMIQSFNKILDYTFSIQGLKWRLESLTTKKPFAEIVLLNTLIYQVEQVFIIHRDTGLVVQHVSAKGASTEDPDLISSMLMAIQNFVQDSFGENIEDSLGLDTLRMGGDRSVWIEQGSHAILAAVIRGTPPVDTRSIFREALDDIHLLHSEALGSFDGDTAPFEIMKSNLESCLQFQAKEKKRSTSPLMWLILSGVVLFIGIWSFLSFQEHQRWSNFLERLHGEPGIVVAGADKFEGKYRVSGLRDPFASDPLTILKETKLEPDNFIFHWEPYHSIYPGLILKRVEAALGPPETVSLELKDGILLVNGSASHQWIVEARRIVRTIPGILRYQEDNLVDVDLRDINLVREKIIKQHLLFNVSETEIEPDHMKILNDLSIDISQLFKLGQVIDKRVHIDIVGHADARGSEEVNKVISTKRANNALSFLISKGLNAENFTALGVGSSEPEREEITEQDRKFNRNVRFRVVITDNGI